jgi:hypothetical protein
MAEDMRVSRRERPVTFSYIAPSPFLRHFIRDYLIAHFGFDQEAPVPHKPYAPKPEQGITFFVRGRPSMADPISGKVHKAPPTSLFGQQVMRCDVHLPPEFLMFRVHFRPGALYRMLNFPIYELGEDHYDAESVLGADVREVSERLALARSYADMIDRVEAFLLGAVRKARQDVHPVDRVARCLEVDFRHQPADWLARQACLRLAQRLEGHALVTRVRYPGLPSHPTHDTARRVLRGFGTIVSFDLRGGAEVADRVCRQVRLSRHATSLGAVESTIERRAAVPGQGHLPPSLLRLSVGIEDAEDLWLDLEAAMASAAAAS